MLSDVTVALAERIVPQPFGGRSISQHQTSQTSGQDVRIMLADDSLHFRTALRKMLETQRGWSICGEVDNGEYVVQRVRALHPDLLILDIGMPSISGLDAALILAEAAPDVPILILSMHGLKEYRARAVAAGVRGYVLKSESPWTIITAIQSVLRNEAFFSDSQLFHD